MHIKKENIHIVRKNAAEERKILEGKNSDFYTSSSSSSISLYRKGIKQ